MRLTQYSSVRALTFKRKILHDDDQGGVSLGEHYALGSFLCVLAYLFYLCGRKSFIRELQFATTDRRRILFLVGEDLPLRFAT
jgi:hypothetical protein